MVAAPTLFNDALQRQWRRATPAPSTVRESELAMDVAMLLVLHDKHEQCARFALSDASPLAGYDWLWTQRVQIRYLPFSSLILCFSCGGESLNLCVPLESNQSSSENLLLASTPKQVATAF